jgi:uncharacterized membrane protein
MYSVSDAALLVASIIGIILPHLFSKTKIVVYFGVVTVTCMFLSSIIGAYIIHMFSDIEANTLFTRLFIVIGISNVVYTFGQFEMMRRMGITRESFDEAKKKYKEEHKS